MLIFKERAVWFSALYPPHLEDLLQANKTCNGWDEAGSLEHVKHLMKQVVAFYGGLSETEIEETLAELRG